MPDKVDVPEADMTDAELDAELRNFGVDPDALLSSAFNKICALYREQHAKLATAEHALTQAHERVATLEAELAAAQDKLARVEWIKIDAEHLPKVGDEVCAWEDGLCVVYSVDCIADYERDVASWRKHGWTQYRAINAPARLAARQEDAAGEVQP